MRVVKAVGRIEPGQERRSVHAGQATHGRGGVLPQRLREARFTVDFCRAVYAHLDPAQVCATAAARLQEHFGYGLAIFSFAPESDLDCLAFVPKRTGAGKTELQCLVLDRLHAEQVQGGASRNPSGGAEVSFGLPGVPGVLRLFQVAETAQPLSRSFLTGVAECLSAALIKTRDHKRLRELALRDGMTGLFNRRAFRELLAIEAGRRGAGPLSVLMIDIDNFKAINDRFGHPAGDEVITAVGKAIGAECRGADLAARYGGEEFAVLLPGAEATNAAGVAERIRSRIAGLNFSFVYPDFTVTVTGSFGVACRREPKGSVDELLREADDALYVAKRSGKNRVSVHEASLHEVNATSH
ncbi:hypothetical protein GMST_15610 [Geomonas silvestris]|uniref:diguanylate cyclase n=1 Tax=Geomonas silvestris TaxID=2740184 RepID=A0A6V8MGX1_9BACT|nr:GGDEF domain-containing protein [Geomonas silvestris]GFO59236.1 hypothetical protein GMST_15610 [Geomonas silvestris]